MHLVEKLLLETKISNKYKIAQNQDQGPDQDIHHKSITEILLPRSLLKLLMISISVIDYTNRKEFPRNPKFKQIHQELNHLGISLHHLNSTIQENKMKKEII